MTASNQLPHQKKCKILILISPVPFNLSCLPFSVTLLYFRTLYLSVPLIMSALSGDLFPPRAPTPSQSSIRHRLAGFLWELVGGCGGPP